eukprot:1825489-Pleurochrysis_carterae.AAC.3
MISSERKCVCTGVILASGSDTNCYVPPFVRLSFAHHHGQVAHLCKSPIRRSYPYLFHTVSSLARIRRWYNYRAKDVQGPRLKCTCAYVYIASHPSRKDNLAALTSMQLEP